MRNKKGDLPAPRKEGATPTAMHLKHLPLLPFFPALAFLLSLRLDMAGLVANVASWSTPQTRRWLLSAPAEAQSTVAAAMPNRGAADQDKNQDPALVLPPLMSASGGYVRQNMVFGSVRRTCVSGRWTKADKCRPGELTCLRPPPCAACCRSSGASAARRTGCSTMSRPF